MGEQALALRSVYGQFIPHPFHKHIEVIEQVCAPNDRRLVNLRGGSFAAFSRRMTPTPQARLELRPADGTFYA